MPATKLARLSNVDVQAISLVRKGANRQTWFLRKSDGAVLSATSGAGSDVVFNGLEPLLEAPVQGDAVFAKADWSAVYCIVAAPGATEGPGMLADTDDPDDVWADADEIRKAAHRFMKNGALVNKMHEDLAPYGTIVENAIALQDLKVDGHTISKGSWYVAIEPTADGRDAIEKGEFTGISIQGTGSREIIEVEKAASKAPAAQGSKGKDREGKGSSQLCPKCKSKVKLGAKACQNCGAKMSGSTGKGKLAKALEQIAAVVGVTIDVDDPDEQEEILKATSTFAMRVAAREVEDDLPLAVDALRGVLYDSIYPFVYGYADAPTPAEARAALDTSLGEFHAHLLGVFDGVAGGQIAKSEELQAQMRTLKENLPSGMTHTTMEDDDSMDQAEKDRLAKLETDMATLASGMSTLTTGLAPVIAKAQEDAKPAPTIEDVVKAQEQIAAGQDALAKMVEKLGTGDTRQPAEVRKSDPADPLAGLLS